MGVASRATALKTSQQSVVGPEQHEAARRGLCSANEAPGVAVSARASGPARLVAGGVAHAGSRDAAGPASPGTRDVDVQQCRRSSWASVAMAGGWRSEVRVWSAGRLPVPWLSDVSSVSLRGPVSSRKPWSALETRGVPVQCLLFYVGSWRGLSLSSLG